MFDGITRRNVPKTFRVSIGLSAFAHLNPGSEAANALHTRNTRDLLAIPQADAWPALCDSGRTMMDSLVQDWRFAWRGLVRAPGFAAVAIATLALGIGANSAIFTVVNAVVMRQLPYPHPERLVRVTSDFTALGSVDV